MLTDSNILESFLSDVAIPVSNLSAPPTDSARVAEEINHIESSSIDYRIRQLSYSSLLNLHSCPREFQLYKLRSSGATPISDKSNTTFAYGHVVGLGLQGVLEGLPKEKVLWNMFIAWHADLMAEDEKLKKSFWSAVIAIERFIHVRESELLQDYELLYYEGKPATELSFCINLPDGFRLRGYVDAVLRHKFTGEILVLECKTTGNASINPAQFKNSAQGIGYSVVLDVLAPEISSYKVLYLVYQTKSQEYTALEFPKTYLQRALWIKELLLDIEMIKLYESHGVYPQHGESCFKFFRECTYLNVCGLSTKHLTKPFNPETDIDMAEYQINLGLVDLIEAQVKKANISTNQTTEEDYDTTAIMGPELTDSFGNETL
jgi:PD-(D/E)XK nuclease superfamily